MTWLHFAILILVIYGAYYGAVVIWDLSSSRKRTKEPDSQVLAFSEKTDPVKAILPEANPLPLPAVSGTGGVDLKRLFALCRDETVEYRKAVSY